MKKITIQDVRTAIQKVAQSRHTDYVLENLNDDELFKRSIGRDLGMLSGQVGGVIAQLSKDKHLHLPHELHKVLPNRKLVPSLKLSTYVFKKKKKWASVLCINRSGDKIPPEILFGG